MDRYKVANIISRCRRQKGVQQEVLCRGICSKANYSRIESGGAEIPLVMVQAFLERLGVDPGQLEELLEGEDYGFYRNRRDIEKVLQDGLDAQAGQLLDAYEGAAGEDRLEIQYVKYCRARVAHLHIRQDASLDPRERERLARDAGRLLQETESLTIPQRRRGMLLSRTELGILLEEMEGIGSEEMQYNMQAFWLKRGNMAGHWLRSGRGLRQSCLGRVTAAAQTCTFWLRRLQDA